MIKYEFYLPDWGEKPEDARQFSSWSDDLSFVVREIYDRNFSRWDYSVTDVAIRKAGEGEWIVYEGEVESVPQFYASRKDRA